MSPQSMLLPCVSFQARPPPSETGPRRGGNSGNATQNLAANGLSRNWPGNPHSFGFELSGLQEGSDEYG